MVAKSMLDRKRMHLLLATCAIAAVWLFLLPALAKTNAAASYLRWLDAKRIDPSAMFYSELECVDGLLLPPNATQSSKKHR